MAKNRSKKLNTHSNNTLKTERRNIVTIGKRTVDLDRMVKDILAREERKKHSTFLQGEELIEVIQKKVNLFNIQDINLTYESLKDYCTEKFQTLSQSDPSGKPSLDEIEDLKVHQKNFFRCKKLRAGQIDIVNTGTAAIIAIQAFTDAIKQHGEDIKELDGGTAQ